MVALRFTCTSGSLISDIANYELRALTRTGFPAQAQYERFGLGSNNDCSAIAASAQRLSSP